MKSKLIFLSSPPPPLVLFVHCTGTTYTTSISKSGSIKKSKIRFQSTTIPIFCSLSGVLLKMVIFCLKEVKFVVGHTGCVRQLYYPQKSKKPYSLTGVLFCALAGSELIYKGKISIKDTEPWVFCFVKMVLVSYLKIRFQDRE
jgi:hypothetical protein